MASTLGWWFPPDGTLQDATGRHRGPQGATGRYMWPLNPPITPPSSPHHACLNPSFVPVGGPNKQPTSSQQARPYSGDMVNSIVFTSRDRTSRKQLCLRFLSFVYQCFAFLSAFFPSLYASLRLRQPVPRVIAIAIAIAVLIDASRTLSPLIPRTSHLRFCLYSLHPLRQLPAASCQLHAAMEKFPDHIDAPRMANGMSRSPSPLKPASGYGLPNGSNMIRSDRRPAPLIKTQKNGNAANGQHQGLSPWSSSGGSARGHGRQKSLGDAIRTIRTRKGSVSQNAHELADALRAPVSPKLVVCNNDLLSPLSLSLSLCLSLTLSFSLSYMYPHWRNA